MTLFLKYLRDRRKCLLAFILFFGIFAAVFSLYRLPLEAVFYPAILWLFFAAVFLLADFRKVKKKHSELQKISRMPAAMMDGLTGEGKLLDEDYQAIISSLRKEIGALEARSGEQYQNMVEYYTIWVHQIKTPIASMRLFLQSEDTAASRRLQTELFRIEQYVEMVLAFLRLDSVTNDYVFREQPLDPIIRQAVKKFSHEFIDRKIILQYEPVALTLVTDEKWLSFVIEQILSNALKYSKEGSVRISLKKPATLCIEDTGIGIAPEDLPRIFEKGYTGYNGRSDKKASGIGLYLCRRVCDNLGIGISARSQLGKGTAMELNLAQYELRGE